MSGCFFLFYEEILQLVTYTSIKDADRIEYKKEDTHRRRLPMNIHEYYQVKAGIAFRTSWLCLAAAFFFFLLHVFQIVRGNILLIAGPFLVIASVQFAWSRLYERRQTGNNAACYTPEQGLLEKGDLLLAYLPAPTIRILLFSPEGGLLGEIRDRNMNWYMWLIPNCVSFFLPKRCGLYDPSGNLLAEYRLRGGFRRRTAVLDSRGELLGIYEEDTKRSMVNLNGKIADRQGKDWVPISVSGFLQSFELKDIHGRTAAAYQKGWMPAEWSRRFNVNTPILTLPADTEPEQRILILGFLVTALNQADH